MNARRWVAGFAAAGVAASILLLGAPANADFYRDQEYWLSSYGIQQAWAVTKGAGQTIAIIDTGVDGSVAELRGAVVGGTDFSGEGSANGQKPVSSESDHGTLVASIAAGRGTGTGNGVIGAAPSANILSISVSFGDDAVDSDDQIAKAVRWAVDHGATVINMSLTRNTLDWPPSWDDAFLYAMQHNVVVVAAAGNRGSGTTEVGAPATMPGVLTVGGVTKSGVASQDASSQGITIGVVAPSEQLIGVGPGGGYYSWAGTSGSAPIVAGIVALVRAAHPDLDANNVIERILATAKDAGAPGVDPLYGHGLVNAAAAVSSTSVPTVTTNPMGSLADWIKLNRRAAASAAPSVVPVPVTATEKPIAAAPNPLGTWLPSIALLRDVGIPVGVLSVFGVALVVLMVSAVRHFRELRRRG